MRRIRRSVVAAVVVALAIVVAAAPAQAAGEEIVVERNGLLPTSPTQWVDPGAAYTTLAWQVGYATCLKLLNYDEDTGTLGPDGVAALPLVSNLGMTYTFTIAAGHRFNDGTAVDAAAFKRGVERATSPVMAASGGGGARGLVGDIAGASAHFTFGGGISGISASGDELSITLAAPAGDFLARITAQFFCATHPSAPAGFSAAPLPSAGPYHVDSAVAGEVVLKRNPHYGGSRTQNLGTIRWVPDGSPLAEDYVPEATPGHVPLPGGTDDTNPTLGVFYLALNTSKPPFDNQGARLAAALAVDRTEASAIRNWVATDQFLSPKMAGHQPATLFDLTDDAVAASAALVAAGPPVDLAVDLCHAGAPTGPNGLVAAAVKAHLEALIPPFVVTIESVLSGYFDPSSTGPGPANPANCDLALSGWFPDYLDPAGVLAPLFSGSAPSNLTFFTGRDAEFAAASVNTDQASRIAALGALDVTLAGTDVPAVALGNIKRRDIFSSRIGCRVLNPAYGFNLNRLCIEINGPAVPGGDPVSTGSDADAASPLQTSVAVPSGGTPGDVTITQGQVDAGAPTYGLSNLLEQQLEITAPAQQPGYPLELRFELDAGLVVAAGLTHLTVVLYRNGVVINACPDDAAPYPSPCVASRSLDGDGDTVIIVRTLAASTYNAGAPFDLVGPLKPVKAPPATNNATGGSTVPVKFKLGGDEGLGVIQTGYPLSTSGACGTTPTDPLATTPNAAGLTYDATSGVYTYHWKTLKQWRQGHTRCLTIQFVTGQQLTATFKFT